MGQVMNPLEALRIRGAAARAALLILAAGVVALVHAAVSLEHSGHIATGMNNHIVWGLPHVFAVFLVVTASGALNMASLASVFGRADYKPLAPLSALLAITLLVGGLAVLLLDLGRPERLLVALTHFNLSSIFALNVFLYSGFLGLVSVYLWTQMERRMNRFTPAVGLAAFAWRLSLTTGTGSIFGFLVARTAFDSALMAPLFIALSLSYGTAAFVLTLLAAARGGERPLGPVLLARLARLQVWFIVGGLYFVAVYHLSHLYGDRRLSFEHFILFDGGAYPALFWMGQIGVGGLVPLWLLRRPSEGRLGWAAFMVVLGGLAQMTVTLIGAQAWPIPLLPGVDLVSSFDDGLVVSYAPTTFEWMLGLGGAALAALLTWLGLVALDVLPRHLDDDSLGLTRRTAAPVPD